MSFDEGLLEWVKESLEPIGAVTLRPMMGAAVLYLDGTVFAVLDDRLWFKADGESAPEWDSAGCERFTFTASNGRTETMNYRRAPDDVYDDPEAMQRWARLALEAGMRGRSKKRPSRSRRSGAP